MIHLIQITHYDSERAISITFSLRFNRFKLRFVAKFFNRKKIRFKEKTWKFHAFEKLIIHIFKTSLIAMFWIVLEKNMNSNSFVLFETTDSKNTFERYLNIRSFADIRRLIHETRVRYFEDKIHLNKNDDLRNRMLFIQQMKTYMLLKYVISHANLTFIIYVFSRVIVLFHDFNKYKYSFEMLYMFWLTCIEITIFESKLVILNNSLINMKESTDKFIAMNLYLKRMRIFEKHLFDYRNTHLRLSQHLSPVRATPSVRVSSKDIAYCTRDKLNSWFQINLRNLLSWSNAFDIYKYDSKRAIFDVDYRVWNKSFLQLFKSWTFDVLRRAKTKH
jgi:hypothetical protein